MTQIGVFTSQEVLDRKQLLVLEDVIAFYTPTQIRNVLLPVLNSNPGTISLRALNWLVTNYAKKHSIVYKQNVPGVGEKIVNIYDEYKNCLWKYRRCRFDPFRRKHRLHFCFEGQKYTTTVGQLNFLYWAKRYGVLEFAYQHACQIERDLSIAMAQKHAQGKSEKNKKTRRLITPNKKDIATVVECTTRICFNPKSNTS
jgi:hypothetical protein